MRWILVAALVVGSCGGNDDEYEDRTERIRQAELRAKAEVAADQARVRADAAKKKVAALERDLNELGKRATEATNALAGAQNEADRQAANARLAQILKERREMESRIATAKAEAARATRAATGVHIPPECLDNPLAKGCS